MSANTLNEGHWPGPFTKFSERAIKVNNIVAEYTILTSFAVNYGPEKVSVCGQ